MKAKYTIYSIDKQSHSLFGWQGSHRRQSNTSLDEITKEHDTWTWAVYKVKDNTTGETVATNAEARK